MQSENKDIYIMFSSTPSKMGSFIRFMTGNKYNHVSLSFREDLGHLYSFARYYKNTPFVGGFVEESVLRYFLLGSETVRVKICKIPISDEKYSSLFNALNG